ncbi:MAG: retroviral-like aspartic protease family protein [Gammaproteobacteria bacterium]|nr:retroviral-like aspartic protease family protein [Gammaproteobacteria bacterium]NND39991.1 retroviral-like aspartic protease family protein [Pseudomonadales bacterium]NNM12120.1 retroviral-like aspartic protease family protein [Pseudomonadales bacterium]RZV59171.1 MAG: hypothetical protein EX270_01940 [Pseudomonadales bacterium]
MKFAVAALLMLLGFSVAVNLYWWRSDREPAADFAHQLQDRQFTTGEKRQLGQRQSAPALAISGADLQLLFDADDFSDALAGLGWLQGQDHEASLKLKQTWLAAAREWMLASASNPRLLNFIDAAIDNDPNDFEFRRLEAEQLAASGRLLQALDRYYELLNESPQHLQGILAADIQRLVKDEVLSLSEAQAWPPLIALAERLLWHEPLHPPWVFIYARALVMEQRYASARSSLQTVLYDEYYGAKARAMLEEVERLGLAEASIPLQKRGSHFLVDGRINGDNKLTLMIDTGATLSVISPSLLQAANVSPAPVFVREATINTAGGKVRAPIFRVESFAIGNYSVPNMQFVLLELDDKTVGDGLLGMNFLRNFAFRLDQKNSLLVLSSPQ